MFTMRFFPASAVFSSIYIICVLFLMMTSAQLGKFQPASYNTNDTERVFFYFEEESKRANMTQYTIHATDVLKAMNLCRELGSIFTKNNNVTLQEPCKFKNGKKKVLRKAGNIIVPVAVLQCHCESTDGKYTTDFCLRKRDFPRQDQYYVFRNDKESAKYGLMAKPKQQFLYVFGLYSAPLKTLFHITVPKMICEPLVTLELDNKQISTNYSYNTF